MSAFERRFRLRFWGLGICDLGARVNQSWGSGVQVGSGFTVGLKDVSLGRRS